MPLTEAQRLAFLKGREKRMANIEKAKLEKAEMEALGKDIMKELEAMNAAAPPEKPKLKRTRKPKTAPVPVEVKVKIDPDPSEALTEPETDPETEESKETSLSVTAPNPVSTSTPVYADFDQDAFANKIVNMLVQKGLGAQPSAVSGNDGKPKTLKPRKPAVKKAASENSTTITPPAPTRIPKEPFVWM